jgi:hypothetical protein
MTLMIDMGALEAGPSSTILSNRQD